MTRQRQKQHLECSPGQRLVTAAFGLFFTALAVVILIVSELSVGPVVAASVIGALGIDAIVSAYRKIPSVLSRIGPLP